MEAEIPWGKDSHTPIIDMTLYNRRDAVTVIALPPSSKNQYWLILFISLNAAEYFEDRYQGISRPNQINS